MIIDKVIFNEERNVSLDIYVQPVGDEYGHLRKRKGILILPGGGYNHLSKREGESVALAYLSRGFQAFVLNYTLNDKWPLPLDDYEMAMKYLNNHLEEYHLSDIVVIGFSAGGHLASSGSVFSEYKPRVLLLGYALTSSDVIEYIDDYPSVYEKIDDNTPPTFLFASSNDQSVSVRNSLLFANELSKHDIPFELHVYPYGHHGYSLGTSCVQKDDEPLDSRISRWVDDSIKFIEFICDNKFDSAF